jgi:hypothetical protein
MWDRPKQWGVRGKGAGAQKGKVKSIQKPREEQWWTSLPVTGKCRREWTVALRNKGEASHRSSDPRQDILMQVTLVTLA